MNRNLLLWAPTLVLLALAAVQSAPAPNDEPATPENPIPQLWKRLDSPEFDPKTTVEEALTQIGKLYDVELTINEHAFEAVSLKDVGGQAIEKPIPAMKNATLDRVLRKVLARIPAEGGASYLLRPDHIEITTTQSLRAEVWGEGYMGPFLPLVNASFDKKPLAEALDELADATAFNVTLDPRAAERAKVAVTANLLNLPLDTAVRILADMADLNTSVNDNVIHVTHKPATARLRPSSTSDLNGFNGNFGGFCGFNGGLGALGGGFGNGQFPLPGGVTKRAVFDKKPLDEALRELLEGTGAELVVDQKRCGEKAKTPVSMSVGRASLQTSIRLLADLADLKPVFMENVVYLTTRENARAFEGEPEKPQSVPPQPPAEPAKK